RGLAVGGTGVRGDRLGGRAAGERPPADPGRGRLARTRLTYLYLACVLNRVAARVIAAAAATAVPAVVLLATPAPALADAQVLVDTPKAGATDVTVTITAEAQSKTSGIASVRVVLPEDVPASDVTLVSGPDGWILQDSPGGYTVYGAPIAPNTNATHVV